MKPPVKKPSGNHLLLGCFVLLLHVASDFGVPASAEEVGRLDYSVQAVPLHQELSPDFCWFHPRPAAIPGFGLNGGPSVIVTIQKHLAASDHFSGLYLLRSDDLGKNWSGPREIPELKWRQRPDGVSISVIDVTPGWHPQSRKVIAIGAKTLYSPKGDILRGESKSYETSYATYDPQTDRWSSWRELEMPETDGKFYRVGCGCSQWMVKPDGSLILPVQYHPAGENTRWKATLLDCNFDGERIAYRSHGDEFEIDRGYGYAEPSLIRFKDRYFLTLRHQDGASVTSGIDGMKFERAKPWAFDDGSDLGNYNTQTHWLAHSDGLFLTYTRRGADNDQVTWNRAPMFIAQVDPEKLQVIRATERILLPNRGVMLGNFGATSVTPHESWVTDAELISRLIDPEIGLKPHPKGGDGTVWLGKIQWSKPNRLLIEKSDR